MSLYVDIEKTLGSFHLQVKFEAENEIVAVFGASGCGKSMTLKCIAGIETPDKGKIILDGKTFFDADKKINLPPQKRKVGYLFQSYAMFPNMTVEQNIAAGIGKGFSKQAVEQKVAEKVKAFFLEGLEKQYPNQLSGGQKQRVALARIMASSPEAILLDEPFSALDDYLKWQLEQELMNTLDSYGKTVLMVSHNRGEVYRFCSQVGIIVDGVMQPITTKEDLFENPKTRSAALLTGCKNISRIEKLDDHHVFASEWGITLTTNRAVTDEMNYIGIHAHAIRGIASAEEADEARAADGNLIDCICYRQISTSWSVLFLLKAKEGLAVEDSKMLRLELPDRRAESYLGDKDIQIWLPKEKLMLFS